MGGNIGIVAEGGPGRSEFLDPPLGMTSREDVTPTSLEAGTDGVKRDGEDEHGGGKANIVTGGERAGLAQRWISHDVRQRAHHHRVQRPIAAEEKWAVDEGGR
jgi:hypothetical protein